MLVIVDAEWVIDPTGNNWLTQLYAERVSPDWQAVSAFSAIIRPPSIKSYKADLPAFSGYDLLAFVQGDQEFSAIEDFAAWLKIDDSLCFWHQSGLELVRSKWLDYRTTRMKQKTKTLQKYIQSKLGQGENIPGNPYVIAEKLNFPTPIPSHCSANDVSVIKQLCSFYDVPQNLEWAIPSQKPPKADTETPMKGRRERLMQRMRCNYFYTPYGRAFHTKECKVFEHVKQVQGCIYYETALEHRRPCLLCKPTADLQNPVAATKKPPKTPTPPPAKLVKAKLLGGECVTIKETKLVGCCHNYIHPGKLTKAILTQHDCIGKQCRFFEKYAESPYWVGREAKKQQKKAARLERNARLTSAVSETDEMQGISNALRECIPEEESHMEIVRVERYNNSTFTVFYVSDNRFADGNRFPTFLDTTRQHYPFWKLRLRHIKDIDGHFVTRQEFHARKR